MRNRLNPCLAGLAVLALIGTANCSERNEVEPEILQAHGSFLIRFKGAIEEPPEMFQKRPFRLQFRVYECRDPQAAAPGTDAGEEDKEPAEAKTRIDSQDLPVMAPETLESCENRYYEVTDTYDFGRYYKEVRVTPTWTHAMVRMLDTEEIDGRYSPGHNPFWFTYTNSLIQAEARDQGRKSSRGGSDDPYDQSDLFIRRKIVPTDKTADLVHDFEFVSQENPIPDKEQEKLAARFAPIIIHKANKKYPPTNLEKYHGKTEKGEVPRKLRKNGLPVNHTDPAMEPYYILPDLEQGEGATHLYYHVRYADTRVSGTQAEALPNWRDNRNYWYEKGDGSMVISYWLWYDGNEGPSPLGNVHQGDLESFAVLVDRKGQPLRFMVTGHDHIMLDTVWNNINSFRDHPIIFIAHGRESDGGNPTSPYGGFEVGLWAGNDLFQTLADPKDIFPDPAGDVAVTIPADLAGSDLGAVRFGPGAHIGETKTIDLSGKIRGSIEKLVRWEEPGWVNREADRDPDKDHTVDENIAWFLTFPGRIGKQPRDKIDYLSLAKVGSSPRNAPFKLNIEQHYTFERPRKDRHYSAYKGDYAPRFQGDKKTPQF